MAEIRIKHPNLDQVVAVPEESYPHHAAAGWVLADQPAPPTEPGPAPDPAAADPAPGVLAPDPSPRRSRSTQKE